MIKVAKFGGTSIGTPARLRKAARSIEKQVKKGDNLLVVVSAMGQTTDEILALLDGLKTGLSNRAIDEIVSVGERLSARLMWGLLEAAGVNSVFLDPSMEEWPIMSDSNFQDAAVDLKGTRRKCRKHLLPLIESGCVPVVCGFLGRDPEGRVTTLGRGASDQSAFLLGYCLNADEIIIVTDVDGVMSADPRIIKEARLLSSIYIEELWDLSIGGAQVMNSKALRFKQENQRARIVHYRRGDLDSGGTEVLGSTNSSLEIVQGEKPVSPVTIVGEAMSQTPGLLARFSEALARKGMNIMNISTGSWSISFFVYAEDAERAVRTLHDLVTAKGPAKAVTKGGQCAMITVAGRELIYTPGVVAKALLPLAESGVNVVEVSTSKAEIAIFVNWGDRRKALKLVKEALSDMEP
jgi:aspartate kinase